MEQFSVGIIMHFCFRSKIDIRKTSAAVSEVFYIDISVFSQSRAISRNLNDC